MSGILAAPRVLNLINKFINMCVNRMQSSLLHFNEHTAPELEGPYKDELSLSN